MRANHLSLCAGIGGIDLGLRRVVRGLRTVAMVEREGFCVSHLASKMEAGELDPCPIYPDLLRFPWEKYRGLVDIVSGGFPCQPFSQAGSRKATEDSRHLWPHIKAGVSVLRPSFCFFENVDGIASAKSPGYHSVLHHVLSDLEEMGFRATAGQFSAEEVGAPHLRKRWFILAHSDSERLERVRECHAAEGWEEPTGYGGSCGQVWPSRPGEQQKKWEPPRTTQPGLGGHVDGVSNRVDRLRALGNVVVPQVAATAFSTLYHQLVADPD
jgi:DNA (cytosine-5)-methyltransferase 1